MNIEQIELYAPYVVIVIAFIIQNNLFVRPEALERKHREVSAETDKKIKELSDTMQSTFKELEDDMQSKYVEINAYKEFQNHIYSKLDEVKEQNDEIKAILMKRRRDD